MVETHHELPAFSPLQRAAQKARAQVTYGYYKRVYEALDDTQRAAITRLLSHDDSDATSPWQHLTREPKQPTIKHMGEHIAHARWLQSLNTAHQALDSIPEAKLQRFADEARALNASRRRAMQETKWVTLAVALIRIRTAQALDDGAEMLIRTNTALTIPDDEPLLRRLQKQPDPEGLMLIDRPLREPIPECNIVDD